MIDLKLDSMRRKLSNSAIKAQQILIEINFFEIGRI